MISNIGDNKEFQRVDYVHNLEVYDLFKPYHRVVKLILESKFNIENIDGLFNELCDIIDRKEVSIQFVLRFLDYSSYDRKHLMKFFASLYLKLSTKYSIKHFITNQYLMNAASENPDDEILNLFPSNSVAYYCSIDDIDHLKEIYNGKFDMRGSHGIPGIDISAMCGSERCFRYLLVSCEKIDWATARSAVKGGNKDIISIIAESEKYGDFGGTIDTAIRFNNNDVADWILMNYTSNFPNFAQCLYSFNFEAASYCIYNKFNLNEEYQDHSLQFGYFRDFNSLSFAIEVNSVDLIKFFIENGADINKIMVLFIFKRFFNQILWTSSIYKRFRYYLIRFIIFIRSYLDF